MWPHSRRLADLPWRLTIAGDLTRDPNEAAKLRASISQHRLADRIEVPGAVSPERLAALYNEADLFVLASRFEGYGMAYTEAIVARPSGDRNDGRRNPGHRTGWRRPAGTAGDVTALAAALRDVIANAELRRRLSGAAAEAARTLPTWRQSGAIFAATLEKLA